EVAARRGDDRSGAVAAAGQQVVLGADALPFDVLELRPNLNFPEHHAPSSLGPTDHPAPARLPVPPPYGTRRGVLCTHAGPPARRAGSARKSRSRSTDHPPPRGSCRGTPLPSVRATPPG